METCYGKTEEDLDVPVSAAYAKERWTDGLHSSNWKELALLQSLSTLFEKCGCDYSLRDWLQPTPTRLRQHLSAIINLAKFREEQIQLYARLNEPVRVFQTKGVSLYLDSQSVRSSECLGAVSFDV